MTSSLQLGINDAKAGRMQEALEHLKDAIIEEPQNAEVWVWIAAIIDDVDKQVIFLEKALEIDPHNIPAQRGLAYLEKRKKDEASVKDDHLSDYTRPITPFPSTGDRQSKPPVLTWSAQTVEELGTLAEADTPKGTPEVQLTENNTSAFKLAPVEVGLLGVVAMVFCFIGLLAASALFNFELPLGFLLGERSPLSSEPPYAGVFLYENEMFFDMQQHQGPPTDDQGIPTSNNALPLIVLWQARAERNQIKLIYETGEYVPIRVEQGRNETILIQPGRELQSGLYCFQQLIETSESQNAFYWCFIVDALVNDDT